MNLLHKKSRWERVTDDISQLALVLNSGLIALDATQRNQPTRRRSALRSSPLRSGLALTGSAVALTLGSAAVSSLRQRDEESENNS